MPSKVFSDAYRDALKECRKQAVGEVLPSEYFLEVYPGEYNHQKTSDMTCPVCLKKSLALNDKKGIISCFNTECRIGTGLDVVAFYASTNNLNMRNKTVLLDTLLWFGETFNINYDYLIDEIELVSLHEGFKIVTQLQIYSALNNYDRYEHGEEKLPLTLKDLAENKIGIDYRVLNKIIRHLPIHDRGGRGYDDWRFACTLIKMKLGDEFKRTCGNLNLDGFIDKKLRDYHRMKKSNEL